MLPNKFTFRTHYDEKQFECTITGGTAEIVWWRVGVRDAIGYKTHEVEQLVREGKWIIMKEDPVVLKPFMRVKIRDKYGIVTSLEGQPLKVSGLDFSTIGTAEGIYWSNPGFSEVCSAIIDQVFEAPEQIWQMLIPQQKGNLLWCRGKNRERIEELKNTIASAEDELRELEGI